MEAMEVMEADVFSWLSTELLLHLLSYLQPDGLIAISATCKTLQAAGDISELWHALYRKRYKISRMTLDFYPSVKINWRLRFKKRYNEERRITQVLDRIRSGKLEMNPVIPLSTVEEWEHKYTILLPEDYKRFITEVGNGNESGFLPPFTCPKRKLDFGAEHPPWAFWREEQKRHQEMEEKMQGEGMEIAGGILLCISGPGKGAVWSKHEQKKLGNTFLDFILHKFNYFSRLQQTNTSF